MTILARVYIVRHGETDANRNCVIQGQMDTPLNDLGLRQSGLVGEALRSVPFDIAYSSDLARATKTAEVILTHHPHVELQKQEDLRERYMGEMEGKIMDAGARLQIPADSTIEIGTHFVARAVRWWNRKILQRTASLPRKDGPYHILITTHGGFIGTLVKTLIQNKRVKCGKGVVIWHCVNTSVTIIEVEEGGQGTVVQYGGISHLRKEEEAVGLNVDVQEAE